LQTSQFTFYAYSDIELIAIPDKQQVYLSLSFIIGANIEKVSKYLTEEFKIKFLNYKIYLAYLTERSKVIIYELEELKEA